MTTTTADVCTHEHDDAPGYECGEPRPCPWHDPEPDEPVEHVVTYDVSCSCGAVLRGAHSAEEAETWTYTHEHDTGRT